MGVASGLRICCALAAPVPLCMGWFLVAYQCIACTIPQDTCVRTCYTSMCC